MKGKYTIVIDLRGHLRNQERQLLTNFNWSVVIFNLVRDIGENYIKRSLACHLYILVNALCQMEVEANLIYLPGSHPNAYLPLSLSRRFSSPHLQPLYCIYISANVGSITVLHTISEPFTSCIEIEGLRILNVPLKSLWVPPLQLKFYFYFLNFLFVRCTSLWTAFCHCSLCLETKSFLPR